MSRGKKLGVLCGILAAVILTLVLVSRLPGQRDKEEGTEILTIPTDKITSVSWEYAGEKLHFANHGDVWVCPEQDTFPVDSALLETMMGQLETENMFCNLEMKTIWTDRLMPSGTGKCS